MTLDRLPYEPAALLDFYEESLSSLGALCERTWHDRLEVLAEGSAARVWTADGAMHATELHFVAADATAARDAQHDVFPGSPLTFRLAEILCPSPLPLERAILSGEGQRGAPEIAVAEKLWRAQFPETRRWQALKPFASEWHFSLLVLARCEIQAIDQHWSLHRVAISLPDGEPDEKLAAGIHLADLEANAPASLAWPQSDPAAWKPRLENAIAAGLEGELARIRARQENSLARELERIDDYFEDYARELQQRDSRSSSTGAKLKTRERLAAARAECARRRADQLARHEIRVRPHLNALLLIAEPVWRAELSIERARHPETVSAVFLPRARRWKAQFAD